ncbi:MAG: 30S ribosomal protein S1, partial [Oscillospiraceae bacterium]|nr:30S ribosomal protein S1 [Oscillospiraceae bacterium]
SLIPIDAISVSRIAHPSDRYTNGQNIRVIVKSNENGRICLTHKELLGTWTENAELFQSGETVSGIVRSVESYGVFVELAPNLAGLAEPFPNAKVGQSASVYIKAIIPEKMKVKLIIVDVFDENIIPEPVEYYITEGKIDKWEYSTENSKKEIISIF